MGWLPLGVAVAGVLYFWTEDVEFKWKVVATALLAASMVMMVVPSLYIPFVPQLVQVVVALWMTIYWKIASQ